MGKGEGSWEIADQPPSTYAATTVGCKGIVNRGDSRAAPVSCSTGHPTNTAEREKTGTTRDIHPMFWLSSCH